MASTPPLRLLHLSLIHISISLADEPTANLDAASAIEIIDIFRAFQQVGVTVVIATHDPLIMARVNPRILRLDQGQMSEPASTPSADGVAP